MSLHRIQGDLITPVPSIQFSEAGLKERSDLQRLLKNCFHVIDPKILIVAEEFSEWEDSRRRIDLLGLEQNGNLVVIELKRDEDGGHMELQALRYAAMVSTLTFEKLVPIFSEFLETQKKDGVARELLLQHLGYQDSPDVEINKAVRIMLIAANFSREITTTVLWLNEQGLDITCTRFSGHKIDGSVFIDIDQVIPLREAEEYMVKVKEKNQSTRTKESITRNYDRFSVTLDGKTEEGLPKRRAILALVLHLAKRGITCAELQKTIDQNIPRFYKVLGTHLNQEAFCIAANSESQTQSFDPVRWFIADDELIHQGTDTFAFSSQWGQHTENCMKKLVSAYPLCGISFTKDHTTNQ